MSLAGSKRRKSIGSPLSMVHKSGENLVVKSVVSGNRIFGNSSVPNADDLSDEEDHGVDGGISDSELWMEEMAIDMGLGAPPEDPALLPGCRIKRNYSCSQCSFFTQNPRKFLYHMRDDHAEKMRIYECRWCIYASKHSQKVQRHIRMCHGPGATTGKMSRNSPSTTSVTSAAEEGNEDAKSFSDDGSTDSANIGHSESMSVHSHEGGDEPMDAGEVESNDGKTDGESHDDTEGAIMSQFVRAEIDEDHEDESIKDDGTMAMDDTEEDELSAEGVDAEETGKEDPSQMQNKGGKRGLGRGLSSGKKFLRCTVCNYVTNVKARFTKHVKYHSMPLIKCDFCDFKTPYKWNLDRHYKNHNGEGNLHCPLCNFTADIKQSLTVHVQNHHANVPTSRLNEMIKQQSTGSESDSSSGEYKLNLPMAGMEAPYLTESGEVMPTSSSSSSLAEALALATTSKKSKLKITPKKGSRVKMGSQGLDINDRHDFDSDFIHPDDILDKNGKIYIKKLKCQYCSFKAVWETEMNRHMTRIHGVVLPKRRNSLSNINKPMPNLIPIQSPPIPNALGVAESSVVVCDAENNASTNTVANNDSTKIHKEIDNSNSEQQNIQPTKGKDTEKKEERGDFRDKSMFLQSLALKPNVVYSVDNAGEENSSEGAGLKKSASTSPSPTATGRRLSGCVSLDSSVAITPIPGPSKPDPPAALTVKRTSFFDKLTQKLVANKCEVNSVGMSKNSVTITSNSTRCQFCRQRCKTSADLAVHLTVCAEAQRASEDSNNSNSNDNGSELLLETKQHEDSLDEEPREQRCTSENRIFVWNTSSSFPEEDEDDTGAGEFEVKSHFLSQEGSGSGDDLVGFETSPGIGAIHVGKLEEAGYDGYDGEILADVHGSVTTTRKVYRCPQPNCGFWATTASRFHVHIVGHYNMKPFECSQCSYKSNWRWDITKHIKLKGMRDTAHHKAKVLLTHESGQRNYRKYDRYLVMMQLKHSADSKLPDCSTVASKRNDVELELSPPSMVSTPRVSPQAHGSVPKLKMPKLTRAPIAQGGGSPATSVKSEEGAARPPPPPALKPITNAAAVSPVGRTIVEKRMLSGGQVLSAEDQIEFSEDNGVIMEPVAAMYSEECDIGPPTKKARLGLNENKKVLWKCKKCPFKHASKEIVVFHIRQYHKPKKGESVSILSRNNLTSIPTDEDGEEISQQLSDTEGSKSTAAGVKETHQYIYNEMEGQFNCKFCPFGTNALGVMEAHSENHFSKPNCHFSCAYCSYSVPTRRELLQHLQLHGIVDAASENNATDRISTISKEETPPKPRGSSTGGSPYKKYHCTDCPYVTDSKGQFLYHKQFHRPRDTPFKCNKCSYNVSHKHLLHQHLRVHGIPPSNIETAAGENEGEPNLNQDEAAVGVQQFKPDEENFPEDPLHPTVLVWRDGKPYRMYRCRCCPQVFGKLNDLSEHEASHSTSSSPAINLSTGGKNNIHFNQGSINSISLPDVAQVKSALYLCEECPARFFYEKELRIHHSFHQQPSEFRCQLCSYSARQQNPHLLSHMKVHGKEYQQKTEQLLHRYPRAAKLYFAPMTPNFSPPVTSRRSSVSREGSKPPSQPKVKASNSIVCPKCPAKFHTLISYQQHVAYHGKITAYRCRYCDYGVETLKNLTLHELLHAGSEITIGTETNTVNVKQVTPSAVSMLSAEEANNRFVDEAYQGNPDFVYPTYVKNGRIKSKRYKCKKCPSAFEKRDQYKVHMGLHGSDQRYKCGVCDYAVTYYANFIQHLKKHATQADVPPELLIAKPLSKCRNETDLTLAFKSSKAPEEDICNESHPGSHSTTHLDSGHGLLKRIWRCNRCPYITFEKNTFEDHKMQHIPMTTMKEKRFLHQCSFCDFASSKKALLKDHMRLHFHAASSMDPPDSYMCIEDVDIYVDGGEDEKIYSEKENYNEDDEKEKDKDRTNRVTYIDVKSSLPLPLANEPSDAEGDEDVMDEMQASSEPIDCTV